MKDVMSLIFQMAPTHLKGLNTELEMKSLMSVKKVFILPLEELEQYAHVQAGCLVQDAAVSSLTMFIICSNMQIKNEILQVT